LRMYASKASALACVVQPCQTRPIIIAETLPTDMLRHEQLTTTQRTLLGSGLPHIFLGSDRAVRACAHLMHRRRASHVRLTVPHAMCSIVRNH
jgi:hypothetical protein